LQPPLEEKTSRKAGNEHGDQRGCHKVGEKNKLMRVDKPEGHSRGGGGVINTNCGKDFFRGAFRKGGLLFLPGSVLRIGNECGGNTFEFVTGEGCMEWKDKRREQADKATIFRSRRDGMPGVRCEE